MTNSLQQNNSHYLTIHFIVAPDFQNWRLDQLLARQYPDYSRSRWQQAIKSHDILLNNQAAKSKTTVNSGDIVSGQLPIWQETPDQGEDIFLEIIHEDSSIIVINKPAGLVVHPAPGNYHGTLLNALLFHYPEVAQLPRAGIIHRLDKETSGLMVIARTLKAHTFLVNQLQKREVGRTYLALVYRYVTAGDTIDLPIGRHPKERVKMAVRSDGKPAVTHYCIEERFNEITLLRVKLETGRTHQIRVHLSAIKYPIVGDSVYGRQPILPKGISTQAREALLSFPRQALHATKLSLTHPESGKICHYHCPLPKDMTELIAQLRLNT